MGCKLRSTNRSMYITICLVLLAKEDEPTIVWWIGQASTPRLRARYWLQFGIFNIIAFIVVSIGIPALIFLIPATILAYQVH